jgi:alpha-galactosidase
VHGYVQRTIDRYDLPTKVVASTNREELLGDADFVITSVSVGGGAYWGHPFKAELEIPRRYGIEQSVADTVSVGAVFRFLRTGPVQHQFFKDMERLCPEALVLNHTNPMAMLTWLHTRDSSMRNVGLCHSVQGTTQELARLIDVPYDQVSYTVAGINHQSWVLEFMRGKEDLYPRLREVAQDPIATQDDRVRFEMMEHWGYFPTESTRHNSEYLPYFRRTPELMAHYNLACRLAPDSPFRIREWMVDTGMEGDSAPVGTLRLSHEYTTGIMEAILTDKLFRFNGNVMNHGLIANLPAECCVEVPCMVDARGVHPCTVGELPPQLAAINRTGIAVQELAVRAVLEHDRELAYHACTLCPLTAALLPLPQIRRMFDELWEAEKDLLLWFDADHKGPPPETCAP